MKTKITIYILFLLSVSISYSQWSASTIVNTPVCTAIHDDKNPVIAGDGYGGALIAWEDYRFSSIYSKVYVQKINSSGVAQWTPNGLLAVFENLGHSQPQITDDGSGGAIIVMKKMGGPGFGEIYVQRIASDGSFPWKPHGIPILSTITGNLPQIISDGSGGAYVVWEDSRWGSADIDIYAQRINNIGTVLWGTNGQAVSQPTGNQLSPQLAKGAGIIFTWQDFRNGTIPDIYAQRMNGTGTPLWTANGEIVCDVWFDIKIKPQVYSDPLIGGSVISWLDYRRSDSGDVYIQKMNSAGTRLWTASGVRVSYINGKKHDNPPRMSPDSFGGVYIVWSMIPGFNYDVYAQRITPAGERAWGIDGIAVSNYFGYQILPEIVTSNSGNAIVSWKDERTGSYDIYTQSLDTSGNLLWTTTGVPICTEPTTQDNVKLCADLNGGAIMTWQDLRNGDGNDIYASRVTSSGIVLPVEISYFGYEQDKNNVKPKWKTNSETNNAGFYIQRTMHETNNWTTIGNVQGGGTTNQPIEYLFGDNRLNSAKYNYRLKQYDYNNNYQYFTMDGDVIIGIPSQSNLSQNYPNPFNPSTNIEYQIPYNAKVTLKIYDITGREIKVLTEENKKAGYYGAEFHPENLSSGIYFYRIVAVGETDKFLMTKKMIYVK